MKYIIIASKNHIEVLVPNQMWDRIRDPKKILVYLKKRHSVSLKQKCFGYDHGDDRGCLNERTVSTNYIYSGTKFSVVRLFISEMWPIPLKNAYGRKFHISSYKLK
jgi:hypothetical protein